MNRPSNQETMNDDVDISKYFRILIRNKKFIALFTLFGAIASILLSLAKKEIWQGDFQIIAISDTPQTSLKSEGGKDLSLVLGKNNDTTQLEILKSPYVLLPVYNFIKELKKADDVEVQNLQYESWIKNNLDIAYKKNTSVLEIKYKDTDKTHIKKVLELISSKYQDYSKNDRKKKLENTKKFLKTQISNLSFESKNNTKELNEFAIENSLGPIDGIFNDSYPNSGGNFNSIESKSNKEFIEESESRFEYLFERLVAYESEFFDASAIYQPNSPTLLALKSKIDTLKTLLRRPTEIIIKHNELQLKSKRLASTISDLEDQLTLVELSIARQPDPWKLISEPKIQTLRYSPNRKEDLLFGTIISFFLANIICYLKEESSGLIFELDELKKNKFDKYLGKLYIYNQEFNDELIYSILDQNNIKVDDKQIGILAISKDFLNINNNLIPPKYFKNKNIKIINRLDITSLKKFDYLITLYSLGEIKLSQLNRTNDLLQMFKNKMLGWMIAEKTEII